MREGSPINNSLLPGVWYKSQANQFRFIRAERTYSPNYYSPQPNPGMPTAHQPHGHRKYILAIIIVGLIGLIVGGLVTSTLLIGPDVTDVTGTVSLGSPYANLYQGTPTT